MRRLALAFAAFLAPLAACTDPALFDDGVEATTTTTGPGASSSAAATSGGGGESSSTGGSGGSPGVGGGGASGGSGGGTIVDCKGDWVGDPEGVIDVDDGTTPASVAIARGELELYWVAVDNFSQFASVMRSVRASTAVDFGPGSEVAELSEVCDFGDDIRIDVSEDGLRAYLTCLNFITGNCPDEGCDIELAERDTLGDDFEPQGTVGTVGSHASLTANELTVASNPVAITAGGVPLFATRNDLMQDFGNADPIDVIVGAGQTVTGTTFSTDLLELYAYGGSGDPARATRDDATDAFGAFVNIDSWPATMAVGAPDLTPDCRSMYVVRIGLAAEIASGIDVIRR
jgi:hypothetical protein